MQVSFHSQGGGLTNSFKALVAVAVLDGGVIMETLAIDQVARTIRMILMEQGKLTSYRKDLRIDVLLTPDRIRKAALRAPRT